MYGSEQPVIIFGAGGHARVVLDILRACDRPVAAIVGQAAGSTAAFDGLPIVVSDDKAVRMARSQGASFLVAIGDERKRCALFERLMAEGLLPTQAIHPTAYLAAGARCGVGSMVCPNAVVGAWASVGLNAIINTGAIVEHDCRIGDHTHIAPGVRLGGQVAVGDGVLVGLGAIVLPGLIIGDGAVIGAGAVVLHDVPAGETVAGVPARVLTRSEERCTA